MAQFEYHIVGGPGKFDLMVSFFDHGRTIGFRLRRKFGDKANEYVVVVINQISKEDGSCEHWMIDGYLVSSGPDKDHQSPARGKFHGYYSTRESNSGWMTITT